MILLGRIWLFCVLTASCAHHPQWTPSEETAEKRIIIFVPDVFQSSLRTPDGGVKWLPWYRSLFGFGDLTYGNPEKTLVAEDVLTSKPAPFGMGRDISGEFIEALKRDAGEGVAFVPFAYDWRASVSQAAAALAERIETFHQGRFRNVQLVCHGMGGLVCASYLRFGAQPVATGDTWQGAKRVTRVVLLGTPFLGSVTAFAHMEEGFRVGLNGSLIGARALVTFPGYLQLLPSPRSDFVVSQLRQDITRTIYGSQNWFTHGWGMFREVRDLAADADVTNRYVLFTAGLEEAAAFSQKLNAPSGPVPRIGVRVFNIMGGKHPTLTRYVWDMSRNRFVKDWRVAEATFGGKWRDLMISDGDGAVSTVAQKLPKAFLMTLDTQERIIPAKRSEFLQTPGLAADVARFLH